MDDRQKSEIIQYVSQGATWAMAAVKIGINPETLLLEVLRCKGSLKPDDMDFITMLEAAGREATEESLKYHNGGLRDVEKC